MPPSTSSNPLLRTLTRHPQLTLSLLATLAFTTVYYLALRHEPLELSFDQLSAFDRQLLTAGNRTLYVAAAGAPDALLHALAPAQWARLASRVDYVAFVYPGAAATALPWVRAAGRALDAMRPRGYGVVLFACGCAVPSVVFGATHSRFGGGECVMLPGFVIGKEWVRFVEGEGKQQCAGREQVLAEGWQERFAGELDEARKEHEELRGQLVKEGRR